MSFLRTALYSIRRAVSNRETRAATWRDLLRRHSPAYLADPAAEAVAWICRAQDAAGNGGVSYGYDLESAWLPPYPETTGYIIPTLLQYAQSLPPVGAEELRERVRRMARWLITVQLDSGALPGGVIGTETSPTVFNTGQVLQGWCRAYLEFNDDELLKPIRRAADWLVSQQDEDGCWRRSMSPLTVQTPATYNVRSASALLEAGKLLDEPEYRDAAIRNFDWALTQQRDNGWFENNCLTEPEQPLTHTIGYTLEGLLDAAEMTGDERYLNAVTRASAELKQHVRADGFLAGRFDANWQPRAFWVCLTGSCQIALVWFRLSKLTGEQEYARQAERMLGFVKRSQQTLTASGKAVPDGVRGAIKGSHPVWGGYDPFRYPNWAAKFFLDALAESAERRAKPRILFYTAILSSTGGGQHAMTLLSEQLVQRGYEVHVFTRPPFDPGHRYSKRLSKAGVPVTVLPRYDTSWGARVGCALAQILLSLPYAVVRGTSLSFSWRASKSVFLTMLARSESRRICRKVADAAFGRKTILHIWGPAALTPLLLKWADRECVPSVYHEMGEADEKYVETWNLQSTVDSLASSQAVICCSDSMAENIRNVYGYSGR
ncbi:MAG TPA: glycosyltransferase, partial [Blastocatellia bacterium]|nr:glycosyltransferase [Blastocatellia bacterium]